MRTPPIDDKPKWFPQQWQILKLLGEYHAYQRGGEYKPIDFNDPNLATQQQIDECKAAINKFLDAVEINSANTFRPLQLRRKEK